MLHNKKLYLSVLTVVTLLAFALVPLAVLADDPPEEVPIEEPVEEPVTEPAEEPIEEPVEEAVEAPIEEPIEEPVGEAVEEPATTDDSVEQPIEDPIEEPAEETVADEPAAADPAGEPAGVSSNAVGTDTLTHNTSWSFQNLGSTTANVSVDFYNTAGTKSASDSFTVVTSASFWAPTYAPLGSGSFNGAIVASSDQPLAAISNQVAVNSTSGKTHNATYKGFSDSQVASTMYAPVAMKNFSGYYTELSIQNAGSGDINVDVHYYNQDGTEVTGSPRTYAVKAGSPTRVAQSDETILPSNWNGSVMVEATDGTTPIALVVNEFVDVSGSMYNQFYSYEGFASGATRITVPAVFINGYGSYNASVSVQNLGTAAAQTTWYFYDTTPGNPNPGTVIHQFTQNIPTSTSVYFPSESYAQTLMDAYQPGDNAWVGAVIIECTNAQPLVAIANELSGANLAGSYTAFSQGATEIYFPLAFVNAYGYAQTSYSISDVSGTAGAVSVTVDYIADTTQCAGCTDWSTTYNFTNTDSQYQPTHIPASAMSGGVYVGSIKITANTAGKTINGIMNELLGGDGQDNFTSFNGFTP